MAETKFYDYATGKEVKNNPEEAFRQLFEHILIDDLGYPKSHIDIEVVLQRGANRNAEEVDIVVYNSPLHRQENAYIIIEIETPKKKYDLQAFSYVTATTAPYCVWFAGFEKNSEGPFYHYRDLAVDPIKFISIPTLPRYGETQETIGKYRKQDLKPAKALKLLFSRMYYKLYGNGPIKREENIAVEVIKMLFCKIMDEINPDDLCEFRATPLELASEKGKKAIRKRIDDLYAKLLKDPDFGAMFKGEQLEYDNDWIAYIVSELQGIALMHEDTNTDALGDAYEILLPSALKGESGQFFTPREIVRFAMDIINPSYKDNETIMDTACGSGGFLSIAIEKLRKQIKELYKNRGFSNDKLNSLLKDYADKYIYGCDIDPLLYRISKSYMAIVGDGKSNIYNFDSLEPYDDLDENFRKRIKPGSVDIITTNPPFGTKIDDTRDNVLEKYELGHKLSNGKPTNTLLDGQDPDKLFVERDIFYLKDATDTEDGGRMVIVLPKQNLSGAQEESVEFRKWLLGKVQITAVIDLPREAFQPHTGTKTSLIFLKKVKSIPDSYPIFMAVSEAVGHDRRGNPLYKKDASGMNLKDDVGENIIWNDLPLIYEQWENYRLTGTVTNSDDDVSHTPSCFVIDFKQITEDPSRRIDAWYWDPNKNNLAKEIEESVGGDVKEIVRLGDLVVEHGIFYPGRHKRNYVEKSEDSVPFYSGTQILQIRPFDLQYQPKDYKPAEKHFVDKDWILITRSGSTGRVVMVTESMVGSMVSEHVIRVICDENLIDPYYVYAYLSTSNIGKVLLEKGIYASVVDHITPDFVSTIPIPRLSPEKEKEIADKVRDAEAKRDLANRVFAEERDGIESLMFGNMHKSE
ncbi:Probable type I restriction enzyme BthVORF4518P M protein [Anaerotruncus sp. 2789STDY5834896]|uniref:Probable type I restriction enzyme BthVORF4518P M protein n=1 Tax=uncultured Anaerotruncus sp. TaxID=905011 RepID=A0A1C6HUA3_9FIRM|nr:Probable type I restriction enzyme BthVORF4518P M protein [uncultured Anaerotruncus sp.]